MEKSLGGLGCIQGQTGHYLQRGLIANPNGIVVNSAASALKPTPGQRAPTPSMAAGRGSPFGDPGKNIP
jgi:hypothetical protein